MTEKRIQRLKRKLQEARYTAICRNPDFAAPLRDLLYIAASDVPRMSTNGSCVYVNPNWLQSASLPSLEFMLAHQQMHIQLAHIRRSPFFAGERFHLACDIVANSHLRELGYVDEQLPGVGKLYHQTFYPVIEGKSLSAEEAFRYVPFDPDALKDKKAVRYPIDSESYWDRASDHGENGVLLLSPEDEDPDDQRPDDIGFPTDHECRKGSLLPHPEEILGEPGAEYGGGRDRKMPGMDAGDDEQLARLNKLRRIKAQDEQAAEAEARERVWQRPNDPRLDWRRLLNTFLQEQLADYSFLPPDRRQGDSDFFLPDFNESELSSQVVVFAVDTSGSVGEDTLSTVYTEIYGALEQFEGKLEGVLLFFDTRVYPPIPFGTPEDLADTIPIGGGGTDFSRLFRYLADGRLNPASIVIFTDGQGEFPEESAARNVPVLWLLSREDVHVPWGRCARMKE